MSVVYKAKDELLNRTVAIKFLAGEMDPQSLARFQREGIAVGRLDDPHIIDIHELNLTPDSKPYLVMDYVDGEPLSSLMAREGRLPTDRALHIVTQVAEALVHAHSRGIVHRDIKPSNIILARDLHDRDFVKLLDFGIAKLKASDAEMQGLTKTGEVFGSPLYMSPEQCMGREVDARGDIYSLGCLFYELLSGKPPHVGDNSFQTMRKHTDEKPITLSQAGLANEVTPAIENIVMRCLEKDPEARYQSVRELLEALTQATIRPQNPRVVAPNRVGVVTVPATSHRGTAMNMAAGVAIGALATAAVLYHQYHSMPSQMVAPTQSTAHSETAPAHIPGQLIVRPVKTMIVEQGATQLAVRPIQPPTQHAPKPVKNVKSAETQKVPVAKPISAHHPKVALETAAPKPKAVQNNVAYLPPPEPKPGPGRANKGKPDTSTELKHAQLQDEVDREVSRIDLEANQQDYSDAEADMKKLLPKAAGLYGLHSQKYAGILENMINKAARNEDYRYAEQVAGQAARIYSDLHGSDCNEMARIDSWLAFIKFKTNDMKEADRLYEQSMRICHNNKWTPPIVALRYADFQMHNKKYKRAEAAYIEGISTPVAPKDIVTRKRLFAGLSNLYKTTHQDNMAAPLEKLRKRYLQSVHSPGQ